MTLDELKGEEVNAVSFVMDYIEFHFNGPVLRAFASPVFSDASGTYAAGTTGYLDKLVSLITDTVAAVTESEDAIRLETTSGKRVIIRLSDAPEEQGTVAAEFQAPDGTFIEW